MSREYGIPSEVRFRSGCTPWLILLLPLLLASSATAQVVSDTLDPRRYYPLEVGNEWQYVHQSFIGGIQTWSRSRIIADSVANGRRYFRLSDEGFRPGMLPSGEWLLWIRYNDLGAVITIEDIASDTSGADSSSHWYLADFGDTLGTSGYQSVVGGALDTTVMMPNGMPLHVAAYKTRQVSNPLSGECCYQTRDGHAADIGWISRETFDGPFSFLVFARVGEFEYGTPRITLSSEAYRASSSPRLQVYPTPFEATTEIYYDVPVTGSVRLSVVDILGRTAVTLVERDQAPGRYSIRWDGAAAAGVYIVHLETLAGESTKKITQAR